MKKNYLYNLILSVSNLLFPILSFPYASRILGPIGIGKVQLSVTLAQYFGLIAALGIPIYGIQEIAKHRHNKEQLSKVFSELFGIFF
jgi:O-antigen/teichoic acid export membrane protein